MSWFTPDEYSAVAELDEYYNNAPRRRWYQACLDRITETDLYRTPPSKILEIGVRSLALNNQSTVIDSVIQPALTAGHKGRIIKAYADERRLLDDHGLEEDEFDLTIACQVFEHLDTPVVAWGNIKRVTRCAVLLTMPWRWGRKHVPHDRDLYDLAEWTHGDLPTDLRKVGSRVMAWYRWK
jgi:hypothetical protein